MDTENEKLYNLLLYKTMNKTYYYPLIDIRNNDYNIVPIILINNLYDKKLLKKQLSEVSNTKLRNDIINFTQKLKISMSYRADNKFDAPSPIPWLCNFNNIPNKKIIN